MIAQHVVRRRRRLEPDDLGARNHHRADLAVVEAEHVAHHLVLLRLDHAGVEPFFEAGGDLLLGHAAVGRAAHAEQRSIASVHHGQQPDERPRDQRQPLHRPRDQARDRLRVHLAQALGHQLAEDDA